MSIPPSTSEHIAAASLALFYRHGFHATGVDLLAREAGVTKKTLYRYYASKEALIEAALDLRHVQFMTRLRSFLDVVPAAVRPLAYFDFLAQWVAESDFHGCAFINATAEYAAPDAAPHQQAAAHKRDIQALLAELCAAAGARSPEACARALFLLGEGLIVASQVQRDESLAEAAKTAATVLWAAAVEGEGVG